MAAIGVVRELERDDRPATGDEQAVLARWSSWGAIPQVFDETKLEWANERAQLRELLSETEWTAARRTTINAHYTDAHIVEAVWDTMAELGFTEGSVLEPGSGVGTFIGMAPETARMTGVELDPLTAAISRGLYPDAEIRTESFAETRYPTGYFDMTVGNVPFADVNLMDAEHNPGRRHSMHNHFILKSLALTRPGGMVAVITSRYTMDAGNPVARQEMGQLADLVGAVRLPAGAFRRSAGTEAVTDLLILRRRDEGDRPRSDVWESVAPTQVGDGWVKVNAYYDVHPDRVLGELSTEHTQYGTETVTVRAADLGEVPGQLRAALSGIVAEARERGLVMTQVDEQARQAKEQIVATRTDLWDGTIVAQGDEFAIAKGGFLSPLPVPKTQRVELRALLNLRDQARDLLELETSPEATQDDMETRRSSLRTDYEAYATRYGPINRFTERRTGKFVPVVDEATGSPLRDPDTGELVPGEEIMARVAPRIMVTLKQDPHAALVRALEQFDEQTQTAHPATLLQKRMLSPRVVSEHADTPAEALAMSLDRTGSVDLELIADLLQVDPELARTQLGELVYDDPALGQLVQAEEYLSGDVRTKLDEAQAAATTDPAYARNVAALAQVLPPALSAAEIDPRLGAVWINAELHRQFLSELLDDPTVVVENPTPGAWEVRGNRRSVRARNQWGTDAKPATEIAKSLMEQRPIKVTDEVKTPDGGKTYVMNPVETTAAQEKGDLLQARFAEWVWEDPARAAELTDLYNRRFNAIVLRDYTRAGEHLTLPGLTDTLQLRPHQRSAVARMVAEPAVGLYHQVGAGKTLEMVVGATELRRMGMVSKPAVVVPNHMLEQFSREWLQAYPHARVLAASSDDLSGDKRRLFVARAAANDWDAVILTQEAFKRIGVSGEFQAEYIERQLDDLRNALEEAKAHDSISVKRIEKAVMDLEENMKKALAMPRDPGLTFEGTGIDYLVVDEAHMYKNLATTSNIPDARIKGSHQATDLHMKLEYLRDRYGDRVATMATATPLANSITEAYVMQRYLRPDLLEAAGVTSFDGWAATFGSTVTQMEVGPAGGFRQKTRFAKFQNVPEMLRMWHVFADVKTAEDLNLPTPQIAPRLSDGKREVETIVLQPTPELEDYIAAIAERADQVAKKAVTPDQDNMLLISTDGRKAALDLRLIDPTEVQTGPVKLDVVAEKILDGWRTTRDNEYLDKISGEPSPIKGGLQLVFSDLGTPNESRWNAYAQLRSNLIQGGMPPDSIRFIHEAKNDAEKARLFAAARAGHVSVLIGSTAKMGMGTNVQDRVTALHHIDCPWRPADLEQRDGRAIRQGNQNSEVALYRYVVERSFDSYSWQTVGRKATFIAQVMKGKLDAREIDDIGDTALSAMEAKALASGNPLVLEKANAEAELAKLQRQQTAHHRAQGSLVFTRDTAQQTIVSSTEQLARLTDAQQRTTALAGDAFTMVIDGRTFSTRSDAAEALREFVNRTRLDLTHPNDHVKLADLGGHTLMATREGLASLSRDGVRYVEVYLQGVPQSGNVIDLAEAMNPSLGFIRAAENKTTKIADHITQTEARIAKAHRTLEEANAQLGATFKHADALAQAITRVAEIDDKIAESTRHKEPAPDPAYANAAGSGRDPRTAIAAGNTHQANRPNSQTTAMPRRVPTQTPRTDPKRSR